MARPRNTNVADAGLLHRVRDDRPKGDQVREILEALAIRVGPARPVPSERALAEHVGVARTTVRHEIRRLVADGVFTVRPASGTYVAQAPRPPCAIGISYSRDMRNRGLSPGARVLEHDVLEASQRVATVLEVPRGTRVLRLVRLRTADGKPMGLERTTVSLVRFPGMEAVDFAQASLYDTLSERWGVEPWKVTATVQAVLPTEDEADLLAIPPSIPCMAVTSVSARRQGIR